jgi:hypothetical protein
MSNLKKFIIRKNIKKMDDLKKDDLKLDDLNYLKINNENLQFKANFKRIKILHRGGWNYVLKIFNDINLFNDNSDINFYDILELNLEKLQDNKKWIGIVHYTPNTPEYLNIFNINEVLLKNINFINAIPNCLGIITLSKYLYDYLKSYFIANEINIKLEWLKHPVVFPNLLFDYKKYLDNSKKKIIQLGQHLRKITTIYNLKNNNFEKYWFAGNPYNNYNEQIIADEMRYLKIENLDMKSVKIYYTKTFEEYDRYLQENIILVNMYDAAVNNAVIECIVRNTPIVVNKLPGVIDYLGNDYPLYFNKESEINDLLTNEKIKAAHEYLKKLNKDDLKIESFVKNFIEILKRFLV